MLEALIFDVDGTLAETEEAHRLSFNAVFASEGLGWVWDQPLYTDLLRITGGKERIAHYISAYGVKPALTKDAIALLHQKKTARYAAMASGGELQLRPGIGRLLRQARDEGVRLAIATTTSLPNVENLIAATLGADAVGWFEVIGAGDQVAAKKPAPDIYLHVLERLRLPPSACLAFEDSRNGLEAARAAGLAVVVTVSSYTADEEFPGALVILNHLGEPGQPCRVIAGPALPSGYIDLETLTGMMRSSSALPAR